MYIPDQKALQEREKEKESAEDFIYHISENRKEQLSIYVDNPTKMLELEKQYGKYLFVPLALPIFELPDKEHFFDWWYKKMAVTMKTGGDIVMDGYGITPFESIDIVNDIGNQWWESNNHRDSFKTEFPKLWQQFNDYVPVHQLLRLTFWSSRHEIHEHRDTAEYMDVPLSYRFMLYDDNPEETLFLFDNPLRPYHCEDAQPLKRAPGTNSFVWNNLRAKHGSVYNQGHKKVIAFAVGTVDTARYEELIERSVNTYKDYCITSKYSIENYINL